MAICYVGLGGNLGTVQATFQESVRQLTSAGMDVTARSGLYRTAAVGRDAGPAFLNAAVELHTALAPGELLDVLQDIEQSLGRTRNVHWGPRTIDLDLLMFESRILQTSRLTLPHPACWYRRFVLDPLAEIAGHLQHPERRLTFAQLRDRLRPRPLSVTLTGEEALCGTLMSRIASRFGDQVTVGAVQTPSQEPVLAFCFSEQPPETFPLTNRVWVADDADAVNSALDVIQAAIDTPVRIAAPHDWNPAGI